jgi:hypothetical protein
MIDSKNLVKHEANNRFESKNINMIFINLIFVLYEYSYLFEIIIFAIQYNT